MSYIKCGLGHSDFFSAIKKKQYIGYHPIILLIISQAFPVQAELYFNPRFLADDPAAVADLSGFEKGQEAPPGIYRVDIFLNNNFITTQDITFYAKENTHGLSPCLSLEQLTSMGVNSQAVAGIDNFSSDACVPLIEMFKDATSYFNVSQQRLELTIPQAFMAINARGYIPPERWDDGITAGLFNYNFTGNSAYHELAGSSNYAYLNLQSGLNIGGWRLRDNRIWNYNSSSSGNKNQLQHINTWMERDIIRLRSRLTLGDSYTQGEIFDSINFRGAQIASNDNMLPDSQKGFAPVIRGIARSTAQVSIRQNGYEIYQSTVPPGAFIIDDLFATGSGGDLEVTIREASGFSQVFNVPWSTVPVLQREGHASYRVTAGEYRSGNRLQEQPKFFQSSLLYGFSDGWTLYGGTWQADRYQAYNLGVGKNMGHFGAISLDVTQADSRLPDDSKHTGESIRFLYNKSLSEMGTNLQLAGYRYSTQGYYNFADTTYSRMSGYNVATQDGIIEINPKFTDYYNLAYNRRGRIQLSVTQQLGGDATLYISGNQQTYWSTSRSDQQIQVGLNTAIGDVNWMLSYNLTKSAWQDQQDHMLSVNINVPFSRWMRSDSHSTWQNASASTSISHDLAGRMTSLAGLHGTLLEDRNLSYNVQSGYAAGGNGHTAQTGHAALYYHGSHANTNIGYSHNNTYRQLYYGVSGGVLAHADGITLSQPLNETAVLIKAPGAGDVKIENQAGVRTDSRGYAVLPYASEYRENRIALDTNTLADNVDLDGAVVNVVPTHGAIVRAVFNARVGIKILMTLTHHGKPVPFGAMVTTDNNQNSGIVADNGQVYMSGMPLKGHLLIKWGETSDTRCVADYQLPEESQRQTLSQLSVVCR